MLIIIQLLAASGLRCGAIHTIKKEGDALSYYSKGKRGKFPFSELPAALLPLIKGMDFTGWTPARIARTLQRYCIACGLVEYSPHDFRHRFSVDYYGRTKDIHALKVLLNHNSVTVTERYLAALDEVNPDKKRG